MTKGVPPVDEERLPWLEPYREGTVPKPAPEVRPTSRGAGFAVGVVAAIAAALSAGYYLGQRGQAPSSETTPMAEAPVTSDTSPMPEPATAAADPILPSEVPPEPVSEEARRAALEPLAPPKEVTSGPLKRRSDEARQRALTNLANERSRLRARRFAEEQAAATAVAVATTRPAGPDMRSWPKMPSPGPAGQVVQLGAFRTEGRALAAYRSRLSRYPVLGSMPRVVVPVMTQPRGQVLYVLRLGTSSRQQSRIVCRNLKASGDHCIVIG